MPPHIIRTDFLGLVRTVPRTIEYCTIFLDTGMFSKSAPVKAMNVSNLRWGRPRQKKGRKSTPPKQGKLKGQRAGKRKVRVPIPGPQKNIYGGKKHRHEWFSLSFQEIIWTKGRKTTEKPSSRYRYEDWISQREDHSTLPNPPPNQSSPRWSRCTNALLQNLSRALKSHNRCSLQFILEF